MGMNPLPMDEEMRERIARRAYEIYLSRAGLDKDGSAETDWEQAEAEFSKGLADSAVHTEPDLD